MNRSKLLIKSITCDACGKRFLPGNHPDGLPNGFGFEMEDGSLTNICAECLIEEGRRLSNEEEKH